MSELKIERDFPLTPDRVFTYLTEPERVLQWWGHDGMTIKEHALDFSRPGAWTSTLVTAQGGTHKMSGEVIVVDPPKLVELTWGWHDDSDQRGGESKVRFELTANDSGGTRFTLTHSELPDDQSAENHGQGWNSVLGRLQRLLDAA